MLSTAQVTARNKSTSQQRDDLCLFRAQSVHQIIISGWEHPIYISSLYFLATFHPTVTSERAKLAGLDRYLEKSMLESHTDFG